MTACILVVDDSPSIRRVVSAILERHGYNAPVASDGQDAIEAMQSGEVKPDLVLLDFVMPRMNGYQFCRALRADAQLSAIPVVLMSAKSDRIRDQFVERTGAIDAITKPFDAQALITVVENALRRLTTRVSGPQLAELDIEEPAPFSPIERTTRRTHVSELVAGKLADLVLSAMAEVPGASRSELVATLRERLQSGTLDEVVAVVHDLERGGEEGGHVLSGDLGVVPIGAVLQLLQVEGQTGVLYCRNGSTEIIASFRSGLIDLVQSVGTSDEFRIGRFFVEERIVTPEQIEEATTRVRLGDEADAPRSEVTVRPNASAIDQATPKRLLGATLLALGRITEDQLRNALTRQSSELLYEVLRWSKGHFDFRAGQKNNVVDSARLGLPVVAVVMEGFRRVDEWRGLERTLGNFDAVLIRDEIAVRSIDMGTLPTKEKVVLDAVNGDRTVRAIIAASHMSSFDVCRVLAQFLEARVLRRRT